MVQYEESLELVVPRRRSQQPVLLQLDDVSDVDLVCLVSLYGQVLDVCGQTVVDLLLP